jgi:hypothetical protein
MNVLIGDDLSSSAVQRRLINGGEQMKNLLGKLSVAGKKCPIRLRLYTE